MTIDEFVSKLPKTVEVIKMNQVASFSRRRCEVLGLSIEDIEQINFAEDNHEKQRLKLRKQIVTALGLKELRLPAQSKKRKNQF